MEYGPLGDPLCHALSASSLHPTVGTCATVTSSKDENAAAIRLKLPLLQGQASLSHVPGTDYRGFFAFCQAAAGGRFPSEPTAQD